MTKSPYIVVFITSANAQEAKKIAQSLLIQKKAACVNIIPGLNSFFWWQGRIDSAKEVLLVVKSQAKLLPGLIKLVKAIHRYSLPEIIALPITGGHKDYLEWIVQSLKK